MLGSSMSVIYTALAAATSLMPREKNDNGLKAIVKHEHVVVAVAVGVIGKWHAVTMCCLQAAVHSPSVGCWGGQVL